MKIIIDFEYSDVIYKSDIPRFNNKVKKIVRELLYINGLDRSEIDKSIKNTIISYE